MKSTKREKSPRGQLFAFRVFPRPEGSLYFTVRVFNTLAELRRYAKSQGYLWRRALGLCADFKVHRLFPDRPDRLRPICGEILFARRHVGTGVVTHESGHAALAWIRRVGMSLAKPPNGRSVSIDEEEFCHALGEIARQIAVKLYATGILK